MYKLDIHIQLIRFESYMYEYPDFKAVKKCMFQRSLKFQSTKLQSKRFYIPSIFVRIKNLRTCRERAGSGASIVQVLLFFRRVCLLGWAGTYYRRTPEKVGLSSGEEKVCGLLQEKV